MARDLDFSPYTVVRAPLASTPNPRSGTVCYHNDARTWPDDRGGPGVTTASHEMTLATDGRGSPVLLVRHGGGGEIISLGSSWGLTAAMMQGLAKLDDRELYAVLYTFHKLHSEAARVARDETATRYGHAFLEGRMKKRRKGGFVRLHIDTGYQPTVNGEAFSPTSYKTPELATAAGVAERIRRKLPEDAKIGWIGRT